MFAIRSTLAVAVAAMMAGGFAHAASSFVLRVPVQMNAPSVAVPDADTDPLPGGDGGAGADAANFSIESPSTYPGISNGANGNFLPTELSIAVRNSGTGVGSVTASVIGRTQGADTELVEATPTTPTYAYQFNSFDASYGNASDGCAAVPAGGVCSVLIEAYEIDMGTHSYDIRVTTSTGQVFTETLVEQTQGM